MYCCVHCAECDFLFFIYYVSISQVDGYHKEETVPFERIRIDIEHLSLGEKFKMYAHDMFENGLFEM